MGAAGAQLNLGRDQLQVALPKLSQPPWVNVWMMERGWLIGPCLLALSLEPKRGIK